MALIIVSAIFRLGLKPQAIICRPHGTSPIGATDNSPAIYCRVTGTMITAWNFHPGSQAGAWEREKKKN